MKRLLALAVVLTFTIAGCGEDEKPQTSTRPQTASHKKSVSSKNKEKQPGGNISVESYGGIKVMITPENPVAADCLTATVKGKLADKTFIWEVNGANVQQNEDNRYCLEGAGRDDVVSVTVGDAVAGGTASVTLGNSLPRVLDTKLEFVAEGEAYVIEITPQTEDADADYVTLSYQWLINGQGNEEHTESRLPSGAYQTGDNIQVKITPEDSYGKGQTYTSRNVNMLSAVPVITSQPPKSFEALEYTYQVEATDVDSSELTFTLEDEPEGMTIDAETGMINWPLAEVGAGEYQIKIIVTDPDGSTGGQEFTLNLEKHRAVKQE
jgi:hypothetical protein